MRFAALAAVMFIAGCDSGSATATAEPKDAATADAAVQEPKPAGRARDPKYVKCWVHLEYRGPDRTFKNPYDQIRGPAELPNLRGLKDTRHADWDNRITHLTVGPTARVTVFSDEDFQGRSRTFEPGEKAGPFTEDDFDDGISSLKIEFVPE